MSTGLVVAYSSSPSRTPEASLAAGGGSVEAPASLAELTPGSEYQIRLIVKNENGEEAEGAVQSFTTFASTSAELPYGRVYEMVTPVENNNANVYIPTSRSPLLALEELKIPGGDSTYQPFDVAANGSRIAYISASTTGAEGQEWARPRRSGVGRARMGARPDLDDAVARRDTNLFVPGVLQRPCSRVPDLGQPRRVATTASPEAPADQATCRGRQRRASRRAAPRIPTVRLSPPLCTSTDPSGALNVHHPFHHLAYSVRPKAMSMGRQATLYHGLLADRPGMAMFPEAQ